MAREMGTREVRETHEINCDPIVTLGKIKDLHLYCRLKCTNCANVIGIAKRIVSKASEKCRESFEMTCNGDHFTLCLWSGPKGNKVSIKVDNEIKVNVTRVTWREWYSGSLKKLITEIRREIERQLYQQATTLQIECCPEVTHQDINNHCNCCTSDNCTSCKRMMQSVRLIATNAAKPFRESLEILCYGNHISLSFASGSRKYQMVIQVIEDKIWLTTTKKAWPFIRPTFENPKESVNIFITVVESDTLTTPQGNVVFGPPVENAIVLHSNNLPRGNIQAGHYNYTSN